MSDSSSSPSPPRATRRIRLFLVVALGALTVALAIAWFSSPVWIAAGIRSALAARGLEDVSVDVAPPRWGRLELRDIRIGEPPELTVGQAVLEYSMAGLRRRRLDAVSIDTVTASLSLDAQGVQMGLLDALRGRDDAAQEPAPPGVARTPGLPVDRVRLVDAHAKIASPWGDAVARFDGSLEGRSLRAAGAIELEDGSARAVWEVEPPQTPAQQSRPSIAPFDAVGTLDVRLDDWRLAPEARAWRGSAKLALRLEGHRFALESASRIGLEDPFAMLAPASSDVPLLVAQLDDAGVELDWQVALRLDRPWSGLRSAAGGVSGSARVAEGVATGTLDLDITMHDLTVGSVESRELRLRGPASFTASRTGGDLSLTLGATPLALRIERQQSETVAKGTSPRVELRARWQPESDDQPASLAGTVNGTGGALHVDAGGRLADVTADDVGFEGDWRALGGRPPDIDGRLSIDTLDIGGDPAPLSPVSLSGPLTYHGDGRRVDFDFAVTANRRAVRARIHGSHHVARGRGRAQLRVSPVEWSDELPPHRVLPVLEGLIERASGRLGVEGALRWGAGLETELTLDADELDLATESEEIEGIVGRLHYATPAVVSGDPQTLRAARLAVAGVEMTDFVFQVREAIGGSLLLEQADWKMLGGRVSGGGVIDVENAEQLLSFRLEQVELAQVLAFLDFHGVNGDGTLGGTIPVRRAGERIHVRGGELFAGPDGGWLRFPPGSLPGIGQSGRSEVDQLGRVLENFRYERLEIGIDGELTGDIEVSLRLLGSNPDEGGQRYDLTLNNQVPLGQIVRGITAVTSVPDEISRRLGGGGP